MGQFRVYLAGPVWHTEDHGQRLRELIIDEWGDDSLIEWADPVEDLKYDPAAHDPSGVVANDKDMIDTCDGLLVIMTGERSVGTWREVEYAKEDQDIPVALWTGPLPPEFLVQADPFSPWAVDAGFKSNRLDRCVSYLEQQLQR